MMGLTLTARYGHGVVDATVIDDDGHRYTWDAVYGIDDMAYGRTAVSTSVDDPGFLVFEAFGQWIETTQTGQGRKWLEDLGEMQAYYLIADACGYRMDPIDA